MGELIYQTDFSNVALLESDGKMHKLDIPIPNWFEFGGEEGARIFIQEGIGSNGKCLGMELFDISKSRRNEFNLYRYKKDPITDELIDILGEEYTIEVKLRLPQNFNLEYPNVDWNFHEIQIPFSDYPISTYFALIIGQTWNTNPPIFHLGFNGRDLGTQVWRTPTIDPYPLKRGVFFTSRFYVKRHETNGIVKIWWNNQLISSFVGKTKEDNPFHTTIAKIYTRGLEDGGQDTQSRTLLVDDLKIWRGYQPPTVKQYSSLSLTLGLVLFLLLGLLFISKGEK